MVRATMILATVLWAVGEALMRRSNAADRVARACWTAAIILALIHVVLAFDFVFMFLNGAVVFAAGTGRVVGVMSLGIVIASMMYRRRVTA